MITKRGIWKAVGVGMAVFACVGLTSSAGFTDDTPSKGDASVALRSARLYVKQQLWDRALEQLEVAVKGDPMNPEAHFLLGHIYADRDSVDLMNRHFDLVLKLKPKKYDDDINAWRDKAWMQHYNNGVRAIQAADKVGQQISGSITSKTTSETNLSMSVAQSDSLNEVARAKKMEEALREFSIAANVNPTRGDSTQSSTYYMIGVTHLRMNQTEKGIDALRKAVEVDPKNKAASLNLGIAYLNAQQPENAVKAFETAVHLNPKDADTLSKLVIGYGALARATTDSVKAEALFDSAMSACDRALVLNPKDAKLLANAGSLYFNRAIKLSVSDRKDAAKTFYGSAEKHFKMALELDPNDASSVFNLGNCYLQLERYDDALAMFKKTVEIDPKDVDSWMQLGVIQVKQKDLDGAIVTFKKVTELKPDHVRAYEFLAFVYAQKDMPKEAKAAFEKAQALRGQGKE